MTDETDNPAMGAADGQNPAEPQVDISKEELDRLLALMSRGCDAVRVVEPSSFDARNYDPATGRLQHPYRCYSALEKGRRCDNCISARAIDTKQAASKFEFVGDDAYFITAHYFEIEGEPRSVEVINKVSGTAGLSGDVSEHALSSAHTASRAVHDDVTGAYNRDYYDMGIRSLAADKIALVHVANYASIRETRGVQVANHLLHAVATAIKRSVRAQDTLIRYESDIFYLQFDNLPSHIFATRLRAIHAAACSARASEDETLAPEIRIGGLERDGKAASLVADALCVLGQTSAEDPIVLERDAEVQDHTAVPVAAPEERLSYAADAPEQDGLTGLMSYRRFMGILREALLDENVALEEGRESLVMRDLVLFDIEDFKAFNHVQGFREGDVLLRCVADALREEFPAEPVTRLATDHFAVLAPRNGLGGRVERIRHRFHHYRSGASVEIKAGVAQLDGTVSDANILLDRAKVACDSIKGWYDHFVRRYDEELDHTINTEQYVISHIDDALAAGDIKVYYQPIVRAATGDICDFEALARWDDPTYGLLPPDSFIGVLERTHLIHRFDRYVLETVCRTLAAEIASGHDVVPVSVNLSPLDFSLMDVYQTVTDLCDRHGIDHSLIDLEVTESALADERVKETISRLREAGFEIWMDDFGSGYSSLNLLKDYHFDVLKIDMAFLAGFEHNERAREILASVIGMAKRLGSRTLVEGVETREEYLFLRRVGCEMLQGFLFRHPTPLEEDPTGGIELEPLRERGYYETIGKIDLAGTVLSSTPEKDLVAPTFQSPTVPLAVVEYRNDAVSYLTANHPYLQKVGQAVPALADLTREGAGPDGTPMLAQLRDELSDGRSFDSEQVSSLDIDGEGLVFHTQRVAASDDASAYVVTIGPSAQGGPHL